VAIFKFLNLFDQLNLAINKPVCVSTVRQELMHGIVFA
jgi:hypothetical protein